MNVYHQLKKLRRTMQQESYFYTLFRVLEIATSQAPVLSGVYWKLAPEYYNQKFAERFSKYQAPIRPCKRIWVDPEMISNHTSRDIDVGVGRRKEFIGVSEGDWDQNTRLFTESLRYKSIAARFKHGVPWEETEFFDHCMRKIQNKGEYWHGCTSKREVMNRFAYVEDLYENIKENGYKSQPELRPQHSATDYVDELLNEILVDIGRDGEFLFVDGRHRLAIAKILGLEKVPVVIDHRHKRWMEKRDQYYLDQRYIHPDIPR